MLAGEGVTAIWNDVVPEGRADFLAWHMQEHMAERVGLPGFRRGRRHAAMDAATSPAFFTLYEADTLEVLQGHDYTNRLNGMTPWTQRVMGTLRGTRRALARVVESHGPGLGGVMLTLRFEMAEGWQAAVPLVRAAADRPGIAGAHLCVTDAAASGAGSEEQRTRQGDAAPPSWFVLVEAADAAALDGLLTDAAMSATGVPPVAARGVYRLEFALGSVLMARPDG
jgi:hypothetical protein